MISTDRLLWINSGCIFPTGSLGESIHALEIENQYASFSASRPPQWDRTGRPRIFRLFGGPSSTTTETPQTDDDEMPTEITLWLEEVPLSKSKRESIDPIVFSELPDAEQEIMQTAMEEGEYTTQIGEESEALSTLRYKIEARANEDLEVYLKDADTHYKVGLVEGDHIIAET